MKMRRPVEGVPGEKGEKIFSSCVHASEGAYVEERRGRERVRWNKMDTKEKEEEEEPN